MVDKDAEKNSDEGKSTDSSTELPKINGDQETKPQIRNDSHELGTDQNY